MTQDINSRFILLQSQAAALTPTQRVQFWSDLLDQSENGSEAWRLCLEQYNKSLMEMRDAF